MEAGVVNMGIGSGSSKSLERFDQRKIGVVHKETPDIGNGSKVAIVVSTRPNSYLDIFMGCGCGDDPKSTQVGDVGYEVWIKVFASWDPTIQQPMEGDSKESGPNEDDHRYSLVGSFQSDVELDINVRSYPINQEESDDPFSSYNFIEELNN
ncbi:hypothetical protein L1987_12717 [Smallanthus sonchifolius]|uniref:Uncharacterized protein n=1 Tax=Smallanthus sonchifolius TaxID=185202 RepID=A0ACB9JGU1_9ASTR|nr:hypothetical protein L1987_12717 [Smallanthus sonchifolius]